MAERTRSARRPRGEVPFTWSPRQPRGRFRLTPPKRSSPPPRIRIDPKDDPFAWRVAPLSFSVSRRVPLSRSATRRPKPSRRGGRRPCTLADPPRRVDAPAWWHPYSAYTLRSVPLIDSRRLVTPRCRDSTEMAVPSCRFRSQRGVRRPHRCLSAEPTPCQAETRRGIVTALEPKLSRFPAPLPATSRKMCVRRVGRRAVASHDTLSVSDAMGRPCVSHRAAQARCGCGLHLPARTPTGPAAGRKCYLLTRSPKGARGPACRSLRTPKGLRCEEWPTSGP